MLFDLLEQLLLPNWTDLIALLPWVLIALVVGYLAHTAWQWRKAGERNRSRVPRRLAGGAPPPGVHMPGPSRWPFVAPIGGALILFALVLAGDGGLPFNPILMGLGLLVTFISFAGWLWDAMHEWRTTAEGAHGGHGVALSQSTALALRPGRAALVPVTEPEFVAVEPPPGVHMPGPSPWPFFAPIAATLILFGFIFSSFLILGGIVLFFIAAAGWLRDAGHEYRSTETLGHAVPETRDPSKAWPRRLVPLFAVVIAMSVLATLAPIGLGYLNGLTPASAGPSSAPVPANPEISASSAISFDVSTLVVPAARPFQLTFANNHDGVPHNVEIKTAADGETLFDGEEIAGVASVTYDVPAIPEGDYYFLCRIHPNMNGSLQSRPETGGPQPGGGPPPAGGVGGETPAPQGSNPAE
jgi:plastocyanin